LCWTFIVSHTWTELSSLPANRNLPDTDRPHDVNPEVVFGGLYIAICWSDLISYRRADLSSEAVENPYPLLWNYNKAQVHFYFFIMINNHFRFWAERLNELYLQRWVFFSCLSSSFCQILRFFFSDRLVRYFWEIEIENFNFRKRQEKQKK